MHAAETLLELALVPHRCDNETYVPAGRQYHATVR